jgi:cytochrome bd-type quinol oxidase subunit 2
MGISTDKEGNVKLSTFDSNVSGTYVKSDDGTYIKSGTNHRLALKEDPEGNQYLLVNMKTPLQTMEKLSSKEVLMESIVRPYVFGIALIGCIIAFFQLFRRKKRKKLEGGALRVRRLSKLLSLFILLLGLVMVMVMFTQSDDFRAAILIVGYVISGLIALGFIGLLFTLPILWRNREGSLWNRAFSTLVMLAGVGSLVYATFLDMY